MEQFYNDPINNGTYKYVSRDLLHINWIGLENLLFDWEVKTYTNEVIEALTLATPDRLILIKKMVPSFLQDLASNFAAIIGTTTYNRFVNRYFEYVNYKLIK